GAAGHRGARARARAARRRRAAPQQRAAALARPLPLAGRRALGDAARRGPTEDRRDADPADVSAAAESQDLRAWLDGFVHGPAFLARYPYYAHVIARLTPVFDPSVPAMGLSLHGGRYYLHANVDALLRTPQYLLRILLHQA